MQDLPALRDLDLFWKQGSFREAVAQLASLSPDDLATLRRATEEEFTPPIENLAQLGRTGQSLTLILAVAQSLYQIQEEAESAEAVVARLVELAHTEPDSRFKDLESVLRAKASGMEMLIGSRPRFELAAKRRETQTAAMPTLDRFSVFVDLRVAPGADGKLVPVVIARLGFDEPILGQSALSFQIPDTLLAELKRLIEDAESSLAELSRRFGESLL